MNRQNPCTTGSGPAGYPSSYDFDSQKDHVTSGNHDSADPPTTDHDDFLAGYDYDLDPSQIAAFPCERRDQSRLLVYDAPSSFVQHSVFHQLGEFIHSGDTLVLNDTKVLTARLTARRHSGGRVEVLLQPTSVGQTADRHFGLALLKPAARIREGEELLLESGPALRVEDGPGPELRRVSFAGEWDEVFAGGEVPLPPYLPREPNANGSDHERYQTVYASRPGAVAAPTAGLHFTDGLLDQLRAAGVRTTTLTLHVGPGTFLPVRTPRLSQHAMHAEEYEISEQTATVIADTRRRGGRVIAVGTTTTRALEAAAVSSHDVRVGRHSTTLMIRPPFEFRIVDALVTNFHLPKSTLLALVSALVGRDRILQLYREASQQGYRFYSYGDAMLLLAERRHP